MDKLWLWDFGIDQYELIFGPHIEKNKTLIQKKLRKLRFKVLIIAMELTLLNIIFFKTFSWSHHFFSEETEWWILLLIYCLMNMSPYGLILKPKSNHLFVWPMWAQLPIYGHWSQFNWLHRIIYPPQRMKCREDTRNACFTPIVKRRLR